MKDKSGIVSLTHGVEGFCPVKHMAKEDGNSMSMDEKGTFKVIEFNKDSKKIIVSHAAVWGEVEETKRKTSAARTNKAVQNLNDSATKSTLGDLDALSALKEKMEKGE